jgi:Flp pilus assembly protein CpaB
MANLRDKLREQSPEPTEGGLRKPHVAKKAVTKALVAKAKSRSGTAARAGAKTRSKAKAAPRASLLDGLDVNRKLLFAALGIAALAGLLAVTYLSDLSDGIMDGGKLVEVYVPSEDLPARKQLDASVVETVKFPKKLLPEGAIVEEKDLAGKITLAPVVKGEILHKKRIGDPSAVTGVAPKLKPSERGFLFVPDGANDIALVKPDDYVDLTATIQTPTGFLSTKVAQRVRVMSVGNRFSNTVAASEEEASAAYGDLLTLAVPSTKVALLTALKQQGNLSLSLREQGDASVTPPEISEGELTRYVLGKVPVAQAPRPVPVKIVPRTVVVREPAPRPVAPRPVEPKRQGLEIYSGSTLIQKR